MVVFTPENFETIGSYYANLLKEKAGIKTIDDFFRETNHGKDIKPLLEKLRAPDKKQSKKGKGESVQEVSESRLNTWSQVFDLFRIPKMTPRMAELLVHAEINSVRELSHRDPVQVWYIIKELDESSYFIVIKSPSLAEIENLVYYARLMTRRIKYGYDVPLVNLPMMNLDWASELQKYKIWTIEDLEANFAILPSLAGKIGMPGDKYAEMLGMCDLCRVNGIDVLIAELLAQAGIKSLQQLVILSADELSDRLAKLQDSPIIKEHPELHIELAKDRLALILQNAREQKITSFLEATA
nr:DUF4332 domain-containing protein [Candidatus Sigynarchaeum springense]